MDIVLQFNEEEQKHREKNGVPSTNLAEEHFRDVKDWAILGTHMVQPDDKEQPPVRLSFAGPSVQHIAGRAMEHVVGTLMQGLPQLVAQQIMKAGQQQAAQADHARIVNSLGSTIRR